MDYFIKVKPATMDKIKANPVIAVGYLKKEINTLNKLTAAYVSNLANNELNSFMRKQYLGTSNDPRIRVVNSDDNWRIELDQKALWIENGRPRIFMEWLLLNNPKAKFNKRGERYASIPFTHDKFTGGGYTARNPFLSDIARDAVKTELKKLGLTLKGIETGADGKPVLGTVHKIPVQEPSREKYGESMFSKPRTPQEAADTGLPEHNGIFYLSGLVVTQSEQSNGKISREAKTFRTITERHKLDNRWFAPEVKPFKGLERATKWASEQIPAIVENFEEYLKAI
jgi:hypothetical protein